jgi:hypothetical protein
MDLVHRTTDLYHELHALDRFEQDYRCKLTVKGNSYQKDNLPGENIEVVRIELKSQRNYVKSLKKRSLWSKTLEDVRTIYCGIPFIFSVDLSFCL